MYTGRDLALKVFRFVLAISIIFIMMSACFKPEVVELGKPVPDFTLNTLNGDSVRLSSLRGKVVVINFWATWCGYCVYEMPDLQELHEMYEGEVVVLAVNVREATDTVAGFVKANGYSFTVLLDRDGKVARTYMVSGLPTTFVVDRKGVLSSSRVGAMNLAQMESMVRKALGR
ncbi:MAG: TlpA family protein disulfide reductase [Bacillota bacterium]